MTDDPLKMRFVLHPEQPHHSLPAVASDGNHCAVIALIGHSAAGKSSCLRYMNSEANADMDVALGTTKSPALETAIGWMIEECRPPVIAVSNHEEMVKALHAAKACGSHTTLLSRIHFVYLHKPKDRLVFGICREQLLEDQTDRNALSPTPSPNTRDFTKCSWISRMWSSTALRSLFRKWQPRF